MLLSCTGTHTMISIPIEPPRPATILFKRTALDPPAEPAADERLRADTGSKKKKALICKFCGHEITSRAESFAMNGSHTHTFINPAGISYRIGCFKTAKGCVVAGESTTEYTWFPGHAWRYAVCGQCVAHLGWYYSAGGRGFFGLILENLVEH
jgi:hypothetical protein